MADWVTSNSDGLPPRGEWNGERRQPAETIGETPRRGHCFSRIPASVVLASVRLFEGCTVPFPVRPLDAP